MQHKSATYSAFIFLLHGVCVRVCVGCTAVAAWGGLVRQANFKNIYNLPFLVGLLSLLSPGFLLLRYGFSEIVSPSVNKLLNKHFSSYTDLSLQIFLNRVFLNNLS